MNRVKEACILIMLSPQESQELRVQVADSLRQQRQQQPDKNKKSSEDMQKIRKRFNIHKLTFAQMKSVLDVCIVEEQQTPPSANDNTEEQSDL